MAADLPEAAIAAPRAFAARGRSSHRFAIALAIGLLGCGAEDAPSGEGGAGGSSGSSHGGATNVSGSAGSSGSTQAGGAGGSAGANGSSGRGGTAGVDGGTGTGGVSGAAGKAGAGGATGKGGASGTAGVDGGGAGTSGKAGASGSGGTTGTDGSSGSGGNAGSPNDAGEAVDARDASRDAVDAASDAGTGPATFHCVNWADPRDNYVNGNLELSGLSSASDTYATVQAKSNEILSEFQTKLSANAIRVPINEPTVSGAWWNAYKGAIDAAVAKGMKVVIAYWAYQNGKPADATAFKNMWQTVVAAYQNSDLVYFDIHNEPYGYGTAWNDAAAQWLTDFPNVPRGRVIVAGTGYDDNVNPVGSDARFAGCILQLHIYGFWHTDWTTQKQWKDSMTSALGAYAARTIVGEWGAPMTTSIDYATTSDGVTDRSYIRAVSDVAHDAGMGSCYWPGLRNGDTYSMTKLNSGASPLTLTINNASGLTRLHWAWGVP